MSGAVAPGQPKPGTIRGLWEGFQWANVWKNVHSGRGRRVEMSLFASLFSLSPALASLLLFTSLARTPALISDLSECAARTKASLRIGFLGDAAT